jgi:hypothetical protein
LDASHTIEREDGHPDDSHRPGALVAERSRPRARNPLFACTTFPSLYLGSMRNASPNSAALVSCSRMFRSSSSSSGLSGAPQACDSGSAAVGRSQPCRLRLRCRRTPRRAPRVRRSLHRADRLPGSGRTVAPRYAFAASTILPRTGRLHRIDTVPLHVSILSSPSFVLVVTFDSVRDALQPFSECR